MSQLKTTSKYSQIVLTNCHFVVLTKYKQQQTTMCLCCMCLHNQWPPQ